MLNLKAKYNKIYLVGYRDSKSASFRVTTREGASKPKEVKFFGNVSSEVPDNEFGVLELSAELWQQWFADCTMLPQMATYSSAAAVLVKEANIFYGCPLCSFHTKDKKVADKHIDEHVNKFITQFEFELEEN